MWFIILAIIICVITYGIVRLKKERKQLELWTSQFPGAKPLPIIGNFLDLPSTDPAEMFEAILGFHNTYGPNVVSWALLNNVTLQVSDPKDIETLVLSKSISKAYAYTFLEPWLGTGLLTSRDRKWFQRRRIITPTFHFKVLEQFIYVFSKESHKLINNMQPLVYSGDFNVHDNITLCTLDVICETAMGVSVNAQDNPDNEYVIAVKDMSSIIFERFFSIYRQCPELFPFSELARQQKKVVKILHNYSNSVIRKRKTQLETKLKNSTEEMDENNNVYEKKRMSFLDLLLTATLDDKPLEHEGIREEVDTFMFEGHDTTTSAITMALYHLSQNPKIQDKVFDEARSLLGDDPTTAAPYNILQEMKYLEMVIKETLRIHPSVPIIGRKLVDDTMIANTLVPKDTEVFIIIIALHNNPKIYPNPKKFDPMRFTPEEQSKRGPYDYIPFSAGSRNCIGQKFAMLEMKATISKVIRNYRLLPCDSDKRFQYKVDLILRPANGVYLKIVPRKYL